MFFRVHAVRKVARVEADLIGDGLPGFFVTFPIDADGRDMRGLAFQPWRRGRFELVLRAFDEKGCAGQTGVVRVVVVQ